MSEKQSPKLHEILAVEKSLAETANHVQKDTLKNLSDRRSLFEGMAKTHMIFDDAKQHLVQAPEVKTVQSTVDEQLQYMAREIGNFYDVVLQKETANQNARANIIVNGKVIAENVPSIVLLGLESKLLSLVAVYNAIPTLDASRSWEPAAGYEKPNVFQTKNPEERFQDVVTKQWKEIVAATQHHPAQTKEIETVERQGKFTVMTFSAALTSEDKATRISRLHALIRAVKEARQRANNVDVVPVSGFGAALFDFING